MNPSEEDLQKVKSNLKSYKQKVDSGESLLPEEDYLELDVDGGRIWLHPRDNGSSLDIHLFDDTGERDFSPARSRISSFLTHELDFRGIHTPFSGNERMNFRVDYENPSKYY